MQNLFWTFIWNWRQFDYFHEHFTIMHIPDIVHVDFYCRYVIKVSLNDVNDETTHAGIQDAPCGNRDKTLAQTVI